MIYFEQVIKRYQDTGTDVLKGASFHMKPKEMCFLTGPSGSGKTTILRLLLREILPQEGMIRVNGEDISKLRKKKLPAYRRKVGMVFQDYKLIQDRTVYENVALAKILSGAPEREIRTQVAQALRMVGMEEKFMRYPSQISQGEQQRVGVARAIVNKPYVILADEPTGNLDPQNAREIMNLLERINQSLGITTLIATNDMDTIRNMKHRKLKIEKGRIAEGETSWREAGL